jgi:hypothetical protein
MSPAPFSTFQSRVEALPAVEYLTGFWQQWGETETGLSVPTPALNAEFMHVSVFVVPYMEYAQLSEEWDHLTTLRQQNISLRPEKAPSDGAKSSTFRKEQVKAPIDICRPNPNDPDYYPIPISLLHPPFACFQDDIRSAPLDPTLAPLAWEFVTELSSLFEKEEARQAAFNKLITQLLEQPVTIDKSTFGGYHTDGTIRHPDIVPDLPAMPANVKVRNETTEGTSDGSFENILYYYEGVRHVLNSEDFSASVKKTRLPSALILHNGKCKRIMVNLVPDMFTGPNIQVSGATCLSKPYIEVISPSIPLHFNHFNTRAMQDLMRLLYALRTLCRALIDIYTHPDRHTVDKREVDFPYYSTYSEGVFKKGAKPPNSISFQYIRRVSRIRLVFEARTEHGVNIFVKFGNGRYGVEAHQAAATCGLSPALLSYQELDGGMWMVVMKPMRPEFKPCDELEFIPEACAQVIWKTVKEFHSLGFVHGDLRDTNVFVCREEDTWTCLLLDFDWSGKPKEVRYPLGVYSTQDVWRPKPHMDGEHITVWHDDSTVENFLSARKHFNLFKHNR